MLILAEVIHSATNTGAGNGTTLATDIVEIGKPLLTVVKRAGGASLEGDVHEFWDRESMDRVDVR